MKYGTIPKLTGRGVSRFAMAAASAATMGVWGIPSGNVNWTRGPASGWAQASQQGDIMAEMIENVTFDELKVGDSRSLERTVTKEDIILFAAVSHDTNPAHLDEEYANNSMFKSVIIHGMWTAGLISCILGTRFPGFGTIYMGQDMQFRRPVRIGDTVKATLTVESLDPEKKKVVLDCLVTNQKDEKVLVGKATVLAPTEKIRREAIDVPKVTIG